MSKPQFKIESVSDDNFSFYENDEFKFNFKHDTFRKMFEDYAEGSGRGSKWVGAILRLYLKKFPLSVCPQKADSVVDNLFLLYSEEFLVSYLRSKNFSVVKQLPIDDERVVMFLESRGYLVEGILNELPYESASCVVCEEHS